MQTEMLDRASTPLRRVVATVLILLLFHVQAALCATIPPSTRAASRDPERRDLGGVSTRIARSCFSVHGSHSQH